MELDAEKHCSHKGCKNLFNLHKWGAIKATSEGWFLQRNGKAWCQEHIPEWVNEWREVVRSGG